MTTSFYSTRDTCRLCGSADLDLAAPLAPIPIATPNFKITNSDVDSPVFNEAVPLELFLCRDCGHLQVLCIGNPDLQYGEYIYTTSISIGLAEHFQEYVDAIATTYELVENALIVEFGSNDGTLLRFFKDRGMRVLGVDPARAIAAKATESGIETWNAFFSDAVAERARAAHGPAAVIIGNNVIANIDDMDPIATGVRELLAPDGVFVFETQYGADVFEKMLLDTVYHEHLSYFNVAPVMAFFGRHEMEIINVEKIWTKGGSIRITVQHKAGSRPVNASVAAAVANENRLGLYESGYYAKFFRRLEGLKRSLNKIADSCHAEGKSVAGYGVSVGTTTLLAQFGLTEKIDVLFDDDPKRKNQLVGPGYRIPVLGPEAVVEKNPGVIIVFAWRYTDAIIAKHGKYLDGGGEFVVPLPEITILNQQTVSG